MGKIATDMQIRSCAQRFGIRDLESGLGESLPLLSSADHEYRPMFTSRTPVSPRVTYHVAEHQSNGGWENDFGEGINA